MFESKLSQTISELQKKHGDSIPIRKSTKHFFGLVTKTTTETWLWISDEGSHWNVTAASSKSHHNARSGPAYAVDIDKINGSLRAEHGLTGAWKTALSIWPIRNKDEADNAFKYIVALIEKVAAEPEAKSD